MLLLRDLAEKINIPESTLKRAYQLWKQSEEQTQGKSIRLNTKAAAVMIVSCKETNLKKDTREIILAA